MTKINEEQVVLDFFSQPENLPLALSVGEQVDRIRQHLNNEFWVLLNAHLQSHITGWIGEVTEDRSDPDCLVGIHLRPLAEQSLFLQPMMEQQNSSGVLRVYFGLMWSSIPTSDKTNLPEVSTLRDVLQRDGYKVNESFLAWRWTTIHPRNKDFLLRFDSQREAMLGKAAKHLNDILAQYSDELRSANLALAAAPQSAAISLTSLRADLPLQTGIS